VQALASLRRVSDLNADGSAELSSPTRAPTRERAARRSATGGALDHRTIPARVLADTAASVTYPVTFSEAFTGVDPSDFGRFALMGVTSAHSPWGGVTRPAFPPRHSVTIKGQFKGNRHAGANRGG